MPLICPIVTRTRAPVLQPPAAGGDHPVLHADEHDDRKQQAAVALSMVFILIGMGWMAPLHFIKPAGIVGESDIVGNRQTGQVYEDRRPPLSGAESDVGAPGHRQFGRPTWVTAAEIAKFPYGSPGRDRGRAPRRSAGHRRRIGMDGLRQRRPRAPAADPWSPRSPGRLARGRPGVRDDADAGRAGHPRRRHLRHLGRAPQPHRPRRPIGHLHPGAGCRGDRPDRDLPTPSSMRCRRRNPGAARDPGGRHAVALGAGPAGQGGSGDRDATGVTSGFTCCCPAGCRRSPALVADPLRTATPQDPLPRTDFTRTSLSTSRPSRTWTWAITRPASSISWTPRPPGDLRGLGETGQRPAGGHHRAQRSRPAGVARNGRAIW